MNVNIEDLNAHDFPRDPGEGALAGSPPPEPWAELLHLWFVRYNPFYILSALLLLGGVYRLDRALALSDVPWAVGVLGLVGVTELYAFLLIVAAAFLTRRGLVRPPVQLALVGLVFLVDAPFHTEALAHAEPWDGAGVLAWCLLAGVKVELWRRLLGLRLSGVAAGLIAAGAVGIGVLPWLFDTNVDKSLLLQVGLWAMAVATSSVSLLPERLRPRITTVRALSSDGEQVLRYAVWALWTLLAASVAARLSVASSAHGLPWQLHHAAPAIWLLLAAARTSTAAWTASAALVVAVAGSPAVGAVAVPFAAATLVWRAYLLTQPRLVTVALTWILGAGAHVVLDAGSVPPGAVLLTAALAYGALAAGLRLKDAAVLGALAFGAAVLHVNLGAFGGGLALLGGGFFSLGTAVAVSLWTARRAPGPDPAPPGAGLP